jgi:hypothetical protein
LNYIGTHAKLIEWATEWLRKHELQKAGKLTFGDLAVGEVFMLVGVNALAVCKKCGDHTYWFFDDLESVCHSGPNAVVRRVTAAHFREWMEGDQ